MPLGKPNTTGPHYAVRLQGVDAVIERKAATNCVFGAPGSSKSRDLRYAAIREARHQCAKRLAIKRIVAIVEKGLLMALVTLGDMMRKVGNDRLGKARHSSLEAVAPRRSIKCTVTVILSP